MSPARCSGFAAILGTAAAVGVAIATTAYADSLPPLPVPPFANETFFPSASEGLPTDVTGIPGLYTTENIPWQLIDGSFVTQHTEFGSQPYLWDFSDKVTDSTGVAPAVGTEWANSALAVPVPVPPGVIGGLQTIPIAIFQYSSLTTPDGTAQNFISPMFSFANNYYDGPAGQFDYLVFPNGTSIPIIDAPADTSAAAATEAGSFWSDLIATL